MTGWALTASDDENTVPVSTEDQGEEVPQTSSGRNDTFGIARKRSIIHDPYDFYSSDSSNSDHQKTLSIQRSEQKHAKKGGVLKLRENIRTRGKGKQRSGKDKKISSSHSVETSAERCSLLKTPAIPGKNNQNAPHTPQKSRTLDGEDSTLHVRY